MTTTTIKSIKPAGGGDYTSITAWAAARVANLVSTDRIEIAEVYSGGNACAAASLFLRTTDGWTTDATHYIEIRAAVGQQHNGVYDTSKAYFSSPGYGVYSDQVIHIKKMQITSTGSDFTICLSGNSAGTEQLYDSCICINPVGGSTNAIWGLNAIGGGTGLGTVTVMNCIGINRIGSYIAHSVTNGTYNVYNCTMRSVGGALFRESGTINSQNNYFSTNSTVYVGTINKGANDATANTEATTANLRSIPYSTATFKNVTVGSEDLHLVVSSSNKLLDHGANLTAQGVTADIVGVARPQFSAFDIGAFENDIPVCWNYTAHYKNSNKLFKASGCGSFPRTLQVPSNVDTSTGRMVDDGILINPDEYRVI